MDEPPLLPLVLLYTDRSRAIEGATRFQKLVFLAQEETDLSEYYTFRPDRFGPFSPKLRRDLENLVESGYINRNVEVNRYGRPRIVYGISDTGVRYLREELQKGEPTRGFDLLEGVKQEYNEKPIDDLLRYVYRNYDKYVTAAEINLDRLFDPDAESEFRTPATTGEDDSSLAAQLRPTPHTLWQMPKTEANAYFYYFTDESYTAENSKYRELDNQLALLGRHRHGLEVVSIDRDRIRSHIWNTIINGFSIENYPALVVAEAGLGVDEVGLATDEFVPDTANYIVIERGIMLDEILSDEDPIRDFLNTLFDAGRNNTLKQDFRKERVAQYFSIGTERLQELVTINP